VGQIEYCPAEVAPYPISCKEKCVIMSCIWVLRKAKGHGFGKTLMNEMFREHKDAVGFATIGFEGHWSPWFKRWQMEKLGFKPIDSVELGIKLGIKSKPLRYF